MKNNSTTWREPAALALSVSLSLVLAGCGGSSDDTPAATPPVTQTPTTPTTPVADNSCLTSAGGAPVVVGSGLDVVLQ